MPRRLSDYEDVGDGKVLDRVSGEILVVKEGTLSAPKDGWQEIFLMNLASCGHVVESSRAAGIHPSRAYFHRKESEDFARKWDEALNHAVSILEAVAFQRALEYSDNLLMFLLKSRKPAVYGNRAEITHKEPIQIEQFDYDQTVSVLIAEGMDQDGMDQEGTNE